MNRNSHKIRRVGDCLICGNVGIYAPKSTREKIEDALAIIGGIVSFIALAGLAALLIYGTPSQFSAEHDLAEAQSVEVR